MSNREMMLKRISAMDFAIVELNLYMDTHPNDREVNEKLSQYKRKSEILKQEYEQKYGPLTPDESSKNHWGWIADPWPWNNDEEGDE